MKAGRERVVEPQPEFNPSDRATKILAGCGFKETILVRSARLRYPAQRGRYRCDAEKPSGFACCLAGGRVCRGRWIWAISVRIGAMVAQWFRVVPNPRGIEISLSLSAKRKSLLSHDKFRSCIGGCVRCAQECEHCATACLQEDDVKQMARASPGCRLRGDLLGHGELHESRIRIRPGDLPRLRRDLHACGDECPKHDMDHCQRCAKACHDCAEECRKMAGSCRLSRLIFFRPASACRVRHPASRLCFLRQPARGGVSQPIVDIESLGEQHDAGGEGRRHDDADGAEEHAHQELREDRQSRGQCHLAGARRAV